MTVNEQVSLPVESDCEGSELLEEHGQIAATARPRLFKIFGIGLATVALLALVATTVRTKMSKQSANVDALIGKTTNVPLGEYVNRCNQKEFLKAKLKIGSFPFGEYFDQKANSNGVKYRIWVNAPHVTQPMYDEKHKYSAMYVLDGNSMCGVATDMARQLMAGRHIRETYIVCIGYPLGDDGLLSDTFMRRQRDFTPTQGSAGDNKYGPMWAGGSGKFIKFLTHELKPMIEKSYPVNPHDGTLVGGSMGGLLTLTAMVTATEHFQQYIASSPTFSWDQEWIAKKINDFVGKAKKKVAFTVYIGAGSLETASAHRIQYMQALEQMKKNKDANVDVPVKVDKLYDQIGWPRLAEVVPEAVAVLTSGSLVNVHAQGKVFDGLANFDAAFSVLPAALRYVLGPHPTDLF